MRVYLPDSDDHHKPLHLLKPGDTFRLPSSTEPRDIYMRAVSSDCTITSRREFNRLLAVAKGHVSDNPCTHGMVVNIRTGEASEVRFDILFDPQPMHARPSKQE